MNFDGPTPPFQSQQDPRFPLNQMMHDPYSFPVPSLEDMYNNNTMQWEQPNRILQQMASAHANIRRNIDKKPQFSYNNVQEPIINHPTNDFNQSNHVDEAQANALLTLLGMNGQQNNINNQQSLHQHQQFQQSIHQHQQSYQGFQLQQPLGMGSPILGMGSPIQSREPQPLFASPVAPKQQKAPRAPRKRASPKKQSTKNNATPIVSSWENCEIPGLISPSNTGVQSPSPPTNSISYNHEDIIGKMKATTDADFFSQQFEFPISEVSASSDVPTASSTPTPKPSRKRKINLINNSENEQSEAPPAKKPAPKRVRKPKAKKAPEPAVEVKQENISNPGSLPAVPEEEALPQVNLQDMIAAVTAKKSRAIKKPVVKEELNNEDVPTFFGDSLEDTTLGPKITPSPKKRVKKELDKENTGVKKTNEKPEKKKKNKTFCNIEGCSDQAIKRITVTDRYGFRGMRCAAHGGTEKKRKTKNLELKECNIDGCQGPPLEECAKDQHGPAGPRCIKHSKSGKQKCGVEGCENLARSMFVKVSDVLGSAGPRCHVHAGRRYCTVPTCRSIGVQPCPEDDLASAGYRCKEHAFYYAGRAATAAVVVEGGDPSSQVRNRTALCDTADCTMPAVEKILDPRSDKLIALCKRHRRDMCNVEGCTTLARGKIRDPDAIGPAGPRCGKHGGGWSCRVPGCLNQARANVPYADEWGPPGPRCAFQHGGMRCNIPGCTTLGRARVAFADQFGEPGMRCGKHNGNPCNIQGCMSTASGSVKEKDKWGPVGQRCTHHGALRCTVKDCMKVGVRKVWIDDQFGGPGLRCKSHNGRRKNTPPKKTEGGPPRKTGPAPRYKVEIKPEDKMNNNDIFQIPECNEDDDRDQVARDRMAQFGFGLNQPIPMMTPNIEDDEDNLFF